jgi:hypothetical protein
MRITIDTEGKEVTTSTGAPGSGGDGGGAPESPPKDVAQRAAAQGALSAGPAPAEFGSEGTAPFVPTPATPETSPEAGGTETGAQSAGAAPGFATQVSEEVVEETNGEDDEG